MKQEKYTTEEYKHNLWRDWANFPSVCVQHSKKQIFITIMSREVIYNQHITQKIPEALDKESVLLGQVSLSLIHKNKRLRSFSNHMNICVIERILSTQVSCVLSQMLHKHIYIPDERGNTSRPNTLQKVGPNWAKCHTNVLVGMAVYPVWTSVLWNVCSNFLSSFIFVECM